MCPTPAFRAFFQGEPVQGLDLFRFDESGLVTEVTVMIRPLSVLAAIAQARSAPPKDGADT